MERDYQHEQDIENALGELLSVLHRDGGHYQSKHGTLKSITDAQALLHKVWVVNEPSDHPINVSNVNETDMKILVFNLLYKHGISVLDFQDSFVDNLVAAMQEFAQQQSQQVREKAIQEIVDLLKDLNKGPLFYINTSVIDRVQKLKNT